MKYTVRRISIKDVATRGGALTQEHYTSVPFGSGKLSLDVDWGTFSTLEDNGNLLVIGAYRGKSNLVGYMIVLSTPMLHHIGKFIAITDSFYVDPAHRGNGLFEQMLERVREVCSQSGIAALRVTVNENAPLPEEMLNNLGFQLAEKTYQQEF